MNILVFGIQGSGKSTHAEYIANYLGVPYVQTGHLFRQIQGEKSALGEKVAKFIKVGKYVPDGIAIPAFEEHLKKIDLTKGVVLDGFPRTLAQAKSLKLPIDLIINIILDENEAIGRLISRGRHDDINPASLKSRIDHFKEKTAPILTFYEDKGVKVIEIDNKPSVEVVRNTINDLLKESR